MRSFRYLPLIVFLATVLSGCPKSVPKPDNALEDPAELSAAIDARVDQIQSIRFREVVLEYFGGGERFKVRQLLLAKKPSFVRVQTRVPGTDEILNLLVSDGKTFAMHRRDTNEYLTGPATPQNIAKLLPVDLSANDVMRVMFGGAPWDRWNQHCGTGADDESTLTWDAKEGGYLLAKACSSGATLKFWVRHTDFAVVKVEETVGDSLTYRYSTDDWKRFGSIALPKYRQFEIPARDLDFSLDIKEIQVDPDLPALLFELEPPSGSIITELP